MKTLKSIQLLVLLPALFFSLGAVEQTKSEESQLKFTVSDELGGWDPSWDEAMQITRPTHVAIFQLENLRIWKSPWVRKTTRVGGKVKVSEESELFAVLERVLFTGEDAVTQPYEFLLSRDRAGENRIQFWLYATSEQDARKKAQVLIEGARDLADVYVKGAEAELELRRKRIADANDEIPKIEIEKRAAEAELAECKKTTHYRSADEAQKSMLEWNNLLSGVEVDIIGIQAKLDMIKQLKQEQSRPEEVDGMTFMPDGGTLWSLDKMRMAEEIELAGALARKNAAESYRKKALKFLDLSEKRDGLWYQLESKRRQLSEDQNAIAKQGRRLPQLRMEARPIEVVDNEVKIHPVE
jgi:hypothetical protein